MTQNNQRQFSTLRAYAALGVAGLAGLLGYGCKTPTQRTDDILGIASITSSGHVSYGESRAITVADFNALGTEYNRLDGIAAPTSEQATRKQNVAHMIAYGLRRSSGHVDMVVNFEDGTQDSENNRRNNRGIRARVLVTLAELADEMLTTDLSQGPYMTFGPRNVANLVSKARPTLGSVPIGTQTDLHTWSAKGFVPIEPRVLAELVTRSNGRGLSYVDSNGNTDAAVYSTDTHRVLTDGKTENGELNAIVPGLLGLQIDETGTAPAQK